jgi:hypothetical protein
MMRQGVTVKIKVQGVERTFANVDVDITAGCMRVSRDGQELASFTITLGG